MEFTVDKFAEIVINYNKLNKLVRKYIHRFVAKDLRDAFDTDWIIGKWVLSKDLTKIKVTMVDANYSDEQEVVEIPTDKIIEFIKKEGFEL
jgi:hypothetical protein